MSLTLSGTDILLERRLRPLSRTIGMTVGYVHSPFLYFDIVIDLFEIKVMKFVFLV